MAKRSQKGKPRKAVIIKRSTMWDDVVVRRLGLIMLVIIVGGLLTLVSMILGGVIPLNVGPQTAETANVKRLESRFEKGRSAENWAALIGAYLQAGRVEDARREVDLAKKANLDEGYEFHIRYAEARVLMYEENYDAAITQLLEVKELTQKEYDKELARGGDKNWAMASGKPANHHNAVIDLISIYTKLGENDKALEMLDYYLEENPYSAGIILDRANLKLTMGDKKGAIKDYEAVLKFLPDNEEAQVGLEKAKEMNQ